MKRFTIIFLFACLLDIGGIGSILMAQDVQQEWVARYNGRGNSADYGRDIAIDAFGNVYVTGRNISGGVNRNDIVTIKYNSDGDELWQANYNYYSGAMNGAEDPTGIAIDEFGNVYVTGYSIITLDTTVTVTLKYNNDGGEQWAAVYTGPSYYTVAEDITVDKSGNVYITGYEFPKSGQADCFTIKYNSFGEEEWVASYNGITNHRDNGEAIVVDDSGNVYVTGESILTNVGNQYMTIKYNSSGEEEWVNLYNNTGEGNHEAADIVIDALGNVYITGRSHSSGAWGVGFDYATIKYNSAGDQVWVARYNGSGNAWDEATALAIDDAGNIYVTGKSKAPNDKFDYVTIKYNNFGEEQWTARYNGPADNDDIANDIAVDSFGNVYVTGYSIGVGTSTDYATVKYNSSGEEQWVIRYNKANSTDEAVAVVTDGQGGIYVTGYSCSAMPITTADFATIKYVESIAPVAPTNLTAIADMFYVTLSWEDNSIHESGFKIERKDSPLNVISSWTLIDSVSKDITGYIDTGLNPNQTYSYRIYSYNRFGNSVYSDSIETTTIIPVELTSFTGVVNENNVLLNWVTATELNNKGFEIQRIINHYSDENWETIGFVAGNGTTSTTKRYSFIDEFDSHLDKVILSYRLKQTDFNGSYEYSNIIQVEVDFTPKEYNLYQNYPNPFNPITTIKYSIPFESHIKLAVYSVLGELIEVLEDVVKEAGYYTYNWDASDYSSGIYIYTLETNAEGLGIYNKLVKKMLLQK